MSLTHTHTHTQLISQGAASSGLSELIVSIERSKDSYKLSEKIIPQLEVLLRVDINIDKGQLDDVLCSRPLYLCLQNF